MTGKLEGKVALVTGASSGIGRAVSLEFARQGAKVRVLNVDWVVLAARREERLLLVADEIRVAGGDATVVVADVSKDEDNKKMVARALEMYGALHITFVNAGVCHPTALVDVTEEVMESLIGPNLKGVAFGLKHQLPALSKCSNKGVVVVNTSAIVQRPTFSSPDLSFYAVSKAGADMLVKYGAIEGAALNVRVTGIAPGDVYTGMIEGCDEDEMQKMAKCQLINRIASPEEIAPFVAFLASDDASVVTGSVHLCDGGWSLKG